MGKWDKEEEKETKTLKDEKNALTIKGQSEMFEQITVQPVMSELDRDNPEQIPVGKPQFVTRLTQMISKSQTFPEKSHMKDSLGVTTDIVQEPFDHSTEIRLVLELRLINQMPATIRPSDAINQEYQPSPQGIST